MITEKRLGELAECRLYECTKEEWKELMHLARLGLWAKYHGIDNIKFYSKMDTSEDFYQHNDFVDKARETLAALPKGDE